MVKDNTLPKQGRKSKKKVGYGKTQPVTNLGSTQVKARPPRIAKSAFYKSLFGKFVKWIIYGVVLLLAVYLCFAVTIMRFLPTVESSPGLGLGVAVKNLTFPGGTAPPGSIVVVNFQEKQGNSTFDRLLQSVVPANNVGVVEVVAGPNGRITWAETGLIAINGNPLDVLVAEKPTEEFLTNEYVVKCITGACKPNSGIIVSAGNIYGEPLNDFTEKGE